MIEIQGNVFKVGDYAEKHCSRQGDTKLGMVRIVEVGATSEISTKKFYKTISGSLFYMEPELGTNRHYNLGNRIFWIESPAIRKNICHSCEYFMEGNPPACNALHTPEVESCNDFQDKTISGELYQDYYRQQTRDFCYHIQMKIDYFRCRYNQRPSKIILHPMAFSRVCDYLRTWVYPTGLDMQRIPLFDGIEIITTPTATEDYIGLVIDTID